MPLLMLMSMGMRPRRGSSLFSMPQWVPLLWNTSMRSLQWGHWQVAHVFDYAYDGHIGLAEETERTAGIQQR